MLLLTLEKKMDLSASVVTAVETRVVDEIKAGSVTSSQAESLSQRISLKHMKETR